MTKNEVLKQVYDLSVNGNFNHENKWSFNKFKKYVDEALKKRSITVMEIELPDSWWFIAIGKTPKNNNGYFWDYYIPETREEDNRLRKEWQEQLCGLYKE